MNNVKSVSTILSVAVLGLSWLGCDTAGADKTEAANAESNQDGGFFERILQPETVSVTVPAGTVLALRLNDTLSSHETPVGADFSAEVAQEISVDGRVAVPAGSTVRGQVTEAHPAKKVGGRAILSLNFLELDTPEGEPVNISARLAHSGKSEVGKDAAIIGGSTIGGAVLGDAIDDGEGGVVGAIVGGIAGTVGALKTKGKPVVLSAGSTLQITLENPITVEVRS